MNLSLDLTGHAARVLIVDDELRNRQLLEVMLTPEGVTLQTASSGEEALAMVAEQPPDLILLDVMMPGIDGYQVAAKIKSNRATAKIPVIMITALDDHKSRMFGLSTGAEEFLTKPVDRAELCTRVRNMLRLKAYSDYHDQVPRHGRRHPAGARQGGTDHAGEPLRLHDARVDRRGVVRA